VINQIKEQEEKQEIGVMITAGHACASHTGKLTPNDPVLI
jgi:hypothetical protein